MHHQKQKTHGSTNLNPTLQLHSYTSSQQPDTSHWHVSLTGCDQTCHPHWHVANKLSTCTVRKDRPLNMLWIKQAPKRVNKHLRNQTSPSNCYGNIFGPGESPNMLWLFSNSVTRGNPRCLWQEWERGWRAKPTTFRTTLLLWPPLLVQQVELGLFKLLSANQLFRESK